MHRIYRYCLISTSKQNIEREVRNIIAAFPDAQIFKERYTGTKTQGRRELDRILREIQPGDTIAFE